MSQFLKSLAFVAFICLNLNSVTSDYDYIESSFGENSNEVGSKDEGTYDAYLSAFEDDADGISVDDVNTGPPNSSHGRFLSHVSLGILNVMKMSPAPNYTPMRQDIFDFLRDNYPLPAG